VAVAKVKDDVDAHGEQIDEIENEHIPLGTEAGHVALVQEFGHDTENIADKNETEEERAGGLCGAGAVCFQGVEGPGSAKTDDHDDFEKFRHGKCTPFEFSAMIHLLMQKVNGLRQN